MAAVDEKTVLKALKKKRAYILENLQSITLKSLRAELENDLGLEKDALKPHKKVISGFVDKVMAPPEEEEQPKEKKKKSSPAKKASESDSDGGSSGSKRKATSSAPRVYSKAAERMRSLCRQATITIPPNTYSKNKTDSELEAALRAILAKHDLSEHAGAAEVAKVKAKLQLQRDLDGIDTSNIIEDSRRSRRGAAATSYKEMLKAASDSEEEDEEEEENGDEEEEEAVSDKEEGSEAEDEQEAAAPSDGSDDDEEKEEEKKEEDEEEEKVAADEEMKEAGEEDKVEMKKPEAPAEPKAKSFEGGAARAAGPALAEIDNIPQKTRVVDWSDDDE